MALRFTERLLSLVRADAHGVLSRLEERELLLAQALRDAEIALREEERKREELVRRQKTLHDRHRRLHGVLERRDEDVALALSRGEDDVARFAAREYLACQRESERCAAQLGSVEDELREVETKLATDRVRFDDLRVRTARVRDRDRTDGPTRPVDVAEADIDLELMRRAQPRGQAGEGAADAIA